MAKNDTPRLARFRIGPGGQVWRVQSNGNEIQVTAADYQGFQVVHADGGTVTVNLAWKIQP